MRSRGHTPSPTTTTPTMMMMMTTSLSWPQEAEAVEQRQQRHRPEQHKKRKQNDRPNISAAYDDNNDNHVNDDANHGEAHNQNNASRSSPSNFSTSALRQRVAPQPRPLPVPPSGKWGATIGPNSSPWLVVVLLLLTAALTASATDSTTSSSSSSSSPTSSPSINGSGTDYALLYGDSTTTTTAQVPAQTTGLSGIGTDAKANAGMEVEVEDEEDADASEYIFDRLEVRIVFITLYTIVFCCCFFGNLLVILVVTLSRRLRSITNFFLANLAFADFCVGLFCVMQNLSIYLIDSWVFGEFLCRMYQFVHSLSYTASIFILVVICMERYFAIVHPITCKQILTAARLRMVIVTVWITSAVYSTPKFVFSKTIKNIHTQDGQEEEICVLDREMFNSKLLDMINFVLLYVMPLLVMTVLYSKIAIALWRSSRGLTPHVAQHQHHQHQNQHQQVQSGQSGQDNGMGLHNSMYHHQHHHHHHHMNPHQHHQLSSAATASAAAASTAGAGAGAGVGGGGAVGPGSSLASAGSSTTSLSRKQSSKYEKRGVSITESQVSLEADRPIVSACRKTSFYHHSHAHHQRTTGNVAGGGSGMGVAGATHMSHSSSNVLRARRGVVRMLIIFVLTFALCNLPYHARKMWQYWSRSYRGDSNFNALLTPLTFLVTYFNSGVNPLLYAFLSRNFRKGMKELLLCSWKKGKGKSSSNSSMHHKRKALQTHSLPTDTTHIGNEQL
ncbi:trissin receptor isoform X2 [Drosophila kikkawai]|uniref:Trissin receptor isoform X2 n=1 Tax=Drosophila kikkawai TaxID=30033 RepID=A0ABM4G9F7_DROKI